MIEKVNPSHPDKIADRIAGAIVDLAYTKNKNPKVAVEVLIGHGVCHIIVETSEKFENYEIKSIVDRIAGKVEFHSENFRAVSPKGGIFIPFIISFSFAKISIYSIFFISFNSFFT